MGPAASIFVLALFAAGAAIMVSAWLDSPGDGLMIQGPVGIGKTHLGCALVMRWSLRGGAAYFASVGALYVRLRDIFSQGGSELELMQDLAGVELLMLDDFCSGGLTDFERRTALAILDGRLNALRPTIVTSNWGLKEIAERMDDRIASRLAAMQQVELKGHDRRVAG